MVNMMLNLRQTSLKPQDIVVSLKIHLGVQKKTILNLSHSLFISAGEVHGAVKRAEKSRLIIVEGRNIRVVQQAFMDFIIYGLKYVFPASTGPAVRGMPTGIAAIQKLDRQFVATDALPYVWPHAEGRITGIALAPLFPSVPKAAEVDPELYKALALIDAIREGAAREREVAISELTMMLAI
jgi:hypothetical protein